MSPLLALASAGLATVVAWPAEASARRGLMAPSCGGRERAGRRGVLAGGESLSTGSDGNPEACRVTCGNGGDVRLASPA